MKTKTFSIDRYWELFD